MPYRSIADILRGLGEVSPSDVALADDACPEPPVSPWVDVTKIAASNARDVLERNADDRSRAERRELYARTLGAAKLSRSPVFRFDVQAKVKKARKVERSAAVKEYHREYMRERRARLKADSSTNLQS